MIVFCSPSILNQLRRLLQIMLTACTSFPNFSLAQLHRLRSDDDSNTLEGTFLMLAFSLAILNLLVSSLAHVS